MANTADFIKNFAEALKNEQVQELFVSVIFKEMKKEISELKETVEAHEEEIMALSAKCENLSAKLDEKTEHIENLYRLKNLIIDGIKEEKEENIKEKTKEIIQTHLDVNLHDEDITTIKRIGKHKQTSPRKVLISFNNTDKRNKIYKDRIKLGHVEGNEIYFNEDLPDSKAQLFKQVREFKKQADLQSCWTFQNQIYVKADDKTTPQIIRTTLELNRFKDFIEAGKLDGSITPPRRRNRTRANHQDRPRDQGQQRGE